MAKKNVGANGGIGSEDRMAKAAEHLENLEARGAPTTAKPIILPKLDIQTASIRLVGVSELICHNWSEKAIRQMLDKQMGIATAGREKKDPVADFTNTLYTISPGRVVGEFSLDHLGPDGHPNVHVEGGEFGFPVLAFKNAAVEACTSLGRDITKVAARQCFHIVGELARIEGQPRMRMDMVRLEGPRRPADIRFRGGFREWSVTLLVRFNARLLTLEQVLNLFNTAGFAVGCGEWRAEKDGSFGQFRVE